jgi:hypothetical protein
MAVTVSFIICEAILELERPHLVAGGDSFAFDCAVLYAFP